MEQHRDSVLWSEGVTVGGRELKLGWGGYGRGDGTVRGEMVRR